MLISRCPRCRAEDISTDAHPTRVLRGGVVVPVLVCRRCYRAAELECRIACEGAGMPYETMPTREALLLLRDFYLDRFGDWRNPELLLEDADREAGAARIRAALDVVERRLATTDAT